MRFEIANRINSLRETAKHANWEGEGSVPITGELVDMALEVVNEFSPNIPMPDVFASPTGYVCIDWSLEDRLNTSFTIAISLDSVIHYIYDCDENDEQFDGKQTWTGKLAQGIGCLLQKLGQ